MNLITGMVNIEGGPTGQWLSFAEAPVNTRPEFVLREPLRSRERAQT